MLRLARTSNLPPFLILCRRNVFQENKTWDKWHPKLRQDLEQYWYPRLTEVDERMNGIPEKNLNKCYVLSMFPYPSGRLHMGHLRVYTVTDVLSRWQRLRGKYVVQPMGWDAFGLPAENAAIERGLSPSGWTNDNIQSMKDQLMKMGLSLDWSRELATCDPFYYKWTQWIFLKLHEHGLTYQRRAVVNWDPVDKTVLADELVDGQGRSWRSGAVVEKRKLRQWYFRTTAYSKSLLDGLKTIEGNQWRDVIQRQRGWIGRLSGTTIEFDVKDVESGALLSDKLVVFTDVPHAISAISFILINSDNPLADEQKHGSETGKKLPFVAVHPLTGGELPIVLSHNLTFRNEESLDSRLGIPFLNEEDAKIAEEFGFSQPQVFIGGRLFNTEQLEDSEVQEANEKVMETLRDKFCGGFPASPLRTDWLISRQRFWGTPIPIIHCKSCGVVPVPEEDLPVKLPSRSSSGDREVVPLALHKDWRKAKCPKCGAAAERETDTMDTFVDSSWYFLRFLDSRNDKEIFDKKTIHEMMPVDIYVGGIEHAIRHLFYARFISHFLFDLGLLPQKEPFVQFLPIGLVMGKTYQVKETGRYVNVENVTSNESGGFVDNKTGEDVVEFWVKMSKSKRNGTDPEDVISRLGVETTRLCMLANTGPHRSRKWEEDSVLHGVVNWQKRLWTLVGEIVSVGAPLCSISGQDPLAEDNKFHNGRRRSLSKVTEAFEGTFVLSVTVAQLQTFTDLLKKVPMEKRLQSEIYTDSLCDLVVCLSPLAPMFSSELWSGLQYALSIRGSTRYDLSQPVQMQRFACSFDENLESPQNATVYEKT